LAELGIKTPGEVESIIGNLSRKQFNHVTCLLTVELLFYIGMRIGELTQILLGDIDLQDSIIKITGKGNRERRVFINDPKLIGNQRK